MKIILFVFVPLLLFSCSTKNNDNYKVNIENRILKNTVMEYMLTMKKLSIRYKHIDVEIFSRYDSTEYVISNTNSSIPVHLIPNYYAIIDSTIIIISYGNCKQRVRTKKIIEELNLIKINLIDTSGVFPRYECNYAHGVNLVIATEDTTKFIIKYW